MLSVLWWMWSLSKVIGFRTKNKNVFRGEPGPFFFFLAELWLINKLYASWRGGKGSVSLLPSWILLCQHPALCRCHGGSTDLLHSPQQISQTSMGEDINHESWAYHAAVCKDMLKERRDLTPKLPPGLEDLLMWSLKPGRRFVRWMWRLALL